MINHPRRLPPQPTPDLLPRSRFTLNPANTVANDAVGDGPEYKYGAAANFKYSFN
ncbi:hypothetical protein ACFQ9X_51700 [Catenulispora yoronensis]